MPFDCIDGERKHAEVDDSVKTGPSSGRKILPRIVAIGLKETGQIRSQFAMDYSNRVRVYA